MNAEMHIEQAKSMLLENSKFLSQLYDEVREFEGADEMKKLLEQQIKTRLEHGEKCLLLQAKQKANDLALQQVKNSSTTLEEFETGYASKAQEVEQKRFNIKSQAGYKEFKKTLDANNGNAERESQPQLGDDDISLVDNGNDVFSLYDPWSKALMRNPVRNVKCGHIYDRDSVNAVIKNNAGIRCPVLGCASKDYIQPRHLVEDKQMLQKVRQAKLEEMAIESSSSEED